MSKITIEIPDNRWYRGEWAHRPADRELIAVYQKEEINEQIPVRIFQYDEKTEMLFDEDDCAIGWKDVKLWKSIGKAKDIKRIYRNPQDE